MPAIPNVGDEPATAMDVLPPMRIRCEDGSLLEVDSLDLPERLKHVLYELDMDNTRVVDEKNLEDSLRVIKHLKEGLDSDGSGHVSNQEMEDGVALLSKLMKEKTLNAQEMPYKHLPECIQEVMREWDADGSGMVGVSELSAAAQAYKKVQQEGRMMKKIIAGMAVVILILMAGMFALSLAAAEMAKEMRGSADGTMESSSGVTVKVASSDFEMRPDGTLIIRGASSNASCPANTTCRRLQAASNVLQVASSETPRRLSSTLPDIAFKELKSLTLKDNLGHSLKVNINSFTRLTLKSSRCGSVIQLDCTQGRLTLDDYEMTADAVFEGFLKDAGMEGLFEDGPVSGFGRRLSSTDGMLEGFFNMLEDVEWACESVSLPSPNDIPQYYHAKIKVTHLHNKPGKAYSKYFQDPADGTYTMLAGTKMIDGKVYKTWTEELVKSAGVTAYLSEYAMHPFQRELRLKKGGIQARIEAMGSVGYRCFMEAPQQSAISAAGAASTPPTMEFRGVVVENGTVLRQWRLDPMGDMENSGNLDSAETTIAMMEAGMIPNRVDYYDVDTDPTGRFASGQPYRIHMYSTVSGSKVDTVKQYESITALPSVFEVSGMLDFFNVSKLDTECKFAKELAAGNSSNATNTSQLDFEHAVMLAEEVAQVGLFNRSVTDPNFKLPPEMHPWAEYSSAVIYNYDKLKAQAATGQTSDALKLARSSPYWDALFASVDNQDELESHRFVDHMADWLNSASNDTTGNDTNASNFTYSSGGRRLARRMGTRTPVAEDGSYYVEITQDDLQPADPEHPMRKLSSAGRRLDSSEPGWKYKAWVTPERIEIEAEVGAATLKFLVQYCHLLTPTQTNWGACQTGRAGAGDIVKLESYCSGRQIFFPFPKVSMELGGLLVYDDTAAMGIEAAADMFMAPLEGRDRVLGLDGSTYRWYDRCNDPGCVPGSGKEKWQLISADGGIGVLGTDTRFFIRSSSGRNIQDNRGNVRSTTNTGGWEKFRVLDAGGGKVYLRSHRGAYLAISEDKSGWNSLECKVTLYRDRNCRGGTKVVRSTSVTGYQQNNWGRRRWGTSGDEWRSAKGEGHCNSVEFYDEDEDESGYEDNEWQTGNFGCFNFPGDLDEDVGGVKIWAVGPDPPVFNGNLILTWTKNDNAKWVLTQDDSKDSPVVSFGDPLLYGGLTFAKEVEIIWGIGASWTTEIGAAGAYHQQHGLYLAEIYGKTILEITPAQIYLLLKFNPTDPWDTKYKKWKMYVGVGYELDTWLYTFRDEYEIDTSDLNF